MNNIKFKYVLLFITAQSVFSNHLLFAQHKSAFEVGKDTVPMNYIVPGTSMTVTRDLLPSFTSSVKGDIISAPVSYLSNALHGRISGLYISQNGGEPGASQSSFRIRGLATLNNTEIPVFVDGFQVERNYLHLLVPEEIETIEVLKDATSLAPFGMRGANGIIWITTKRGSIGETKVNVQMRSGLQQPMLFNKPLRSAGYASLYNEAKSNDEGYWNPFYTNADLATMPDVDWYEEMLKNTAPYNDLNASISGGSSYLKYYVNLGYVGQQGLYNVKNTDTTSTAGNERFNIRTNIDANLFNFIEMKMGIGARIDTKRHPNRSSANFWSDMATYPSNIYPIMQGDSVWSGTATFPNNPVAELKAKGITSTHERTLQANFELKERLDFIVKGLYILQGMSVSNWTRDGASNTANYGRYFNGTLQTTDFNTPYTRGENAGTDQWNWQHYTAKAGYDYHNNVHTLSTSLSFLQNSLSVDVDTYSNAGEAINYRHMNVAGGASYSYKQKYLATLAFSYCGSDNFKPGNQWGFYPSVSLGWIATKEDFLKNYAVIDYLKVKSSVGKNGWDPIGEKRFLWEQYYIGSGGVRTGNDAGATYNGGLGPSFLANPNIFAETSMKYDVGFEMRLMKKLNLDATVFIERRTGIILQDVMRPSTTGTVMPYSNIGEVTNQGVDLNISWNDKVGEFNYNITGMASYNSNRIDYMAELITIPTAARTGSRIGSVYGYIADGFYDITDFGTDNKLLPTLPRNTFGNVQPGDVKYRDMDGNMVIDENDQTKIGGTHTPKLYTALSIGIEWKGFDLFALFEGSFDRTVNLLSSASTQTIAFRNNTNVFPIALNRWAYYPDQGIDTRATATYPRLSLMDNNNNYRNSTLWLRNGDFIKLRNVELGYSFQSSALKNAGITDVRIFATGINLLTISKILQELNTDPERLAGYPAMKSYNIGLNVTF